MSDAKHWIKPEIQALKAYSVADAAGMIKLDAMESPYTWPASLLQEWLMVLTRAELNRYPDPHAVKLKNQIRETIGIAEKYDILLGNGSDEIIQLLILSVQGAQRSVLAPAPSFVMYELVAKMASMNFIGVDLLPSLQLNMPAMLQEIKTHQPALIFLAHPNNPTGQIYPEADLRAILQSAEGLVVIDEAYAPFTSVNALPLLDEFNNLVVLRTFSKMGLAGLRLGYLVGRTEWLNEFEKLRLPYNINTLTQLSVEFALQNYAAFIDQTKKMCAQREYLTEQLRGLNGFQVWSSEANFILVKSLQESATEIFQRLKQKNICVKNCQGAHPLLDNCLRFSVGTESENKALLSGIK